MLRAAMMGKKTTTGDRRQTGGATYKQAFIRTPPTVWGFSSVLLTHPKKKLNEKRALYFTFLNRVKKTP